MDVDLAGCFVQRLRKLGDEEPALRDIHVLAEAGAEAAPGVTAQFLENAPDYHARYANVEHFRVLLADALARLDPPLEPRMILDIGSGSGNSVIPLLELFPQAFVVATDISPQLLAILRDELADRPDCSGRYALVNIDADAARYQRGAFDLVVGAAILHHVMHPDRILDACQAALRPGGAAIFFEPFELGHALLHLAYRDIVSEAGRRGEHAPGIDMLRRLAQDYAVRAAGGPLQALDDKWLFTRAYFEDAARRGRWVECHVDAIHDTGSPLTDETRVNLRLGMGLEPHALPAWAWETLSAHERALSRAARGEAMFEGAIVMRTARTPLAGPRRAGWWLDPSAPGQGFFIDMSDDLARIVCCVYDDDGQPVWHASDATRAGGEILSTTTRTLAWPGRADEATRDAPRVLTLRFLGPDRARLRWGDRERELALQHAGSPGWTAADGVGLGGCWIDGAQSLRALLVEYLEARLFVALLSPHDWCVASLTRRAPLAYAGQWQRFTGGQTADGPFKPPSGPRALGDAWLAWTPKGRLVVETPGAAPHLMQRTG